METSAELPAGLLSTDNSLQGFKELHYRSISQLFTFNEVKWVEIGKGPLAIIENTNNTFELVLRKNTDNSILIKVQIEKDPLCKLIQHAGNDRAWTFTGRKSNSDSVFTFAVMFHTPDMAAHFKKSFEEIRLKLT